MMSANWYLARSHQRDRTRFPSPSGYRLLKLCLALVATLTTAMGCRTRHDDLIVPGDRVGEVRIGHTTVRDVGPGDGSVGPEWIAKGLDIGFDKNLKVTDVIVTKPTFKTLQGITVGTPKTALISVYGKADIVDVPITDGDQRIGTRFHDALRYPGIIFALADDKVTAIVVQRK